MGSEKKTRLLMTGLGFGCFALLLASARLALPRASHAGSNHIQTSVDAAFAVNPTMATAPFDAPSRFLPKVSRTGTVRAIHGPMHWPHGPHGPHWPHGNHGPDGINRHHGVFGPGPRESNRDSLAHPPFPPARRPFQQARPPFDPPLPPAHPLYRVGPQEPHNMKPFWPSEDQTLRKEDTEYHDRIDYTKERARLDALIGSAHDSWPGESKDPLTLSRVFLLFFNPDTKNEGIYTLGSRYAMKLEKYTLSPKLCCLRSRKTQSGLQPISRLTGSPHRR